MKRKNFAKQIVLDNAGSEVVLSYDDIVRIVSEAKRNRSDAVTEQIREFITPLKVKTPDLDFSLFQVK